MTKTRTGFIRRLNSTAFSIEIHWKTRISDRAGRLGVNGVGNLMLSAVVRRGGLRSQALGAVADLRGCVCSPSGASGGVWKPGFLKVCLSARGATLGASNGVGLIPKPREGSLASTRASELASVASMALTTAAKEA